MPVEFKRNKKTGIVEVWESGKKIGEMISMGDEVLGNGSGVRQQSGRSPERKPSGNQKSRRNNRRHG